MKASTAGRLGPKRRLGRTSLTLLACGAALSVAACNAAIGGGMVAVLGGVGVVASQCYDRVRVRVRDADTGQSTCSAEVRLIDADGSERRLRPCYTAALTDGKWRLVARQAGYVDASTELEIREREGACPHYTHSIELTLRREGAPASEAVARRGAGSREPASPAPAPSPTGDLESPPARVVPPPLPGVPMVPTRSFDPVPATPGAQPPASGAAPAAPGTPPAPESAPPAAPPQPAPESAPPAAPPQPAAPPAPR